jgi:hypothetical protein
MIMLVDTTAPAFPNASWSSSCVVEYGKPPMYNFVAIQLLLMCKATSFSSASAPPKKSIGRPVETY